MIGTLASDKHEKIFDLFQLPWLYSYLCFSIFNIWYYICNIFDPFRLYHWLFEFRPQYFSIFFLHSIFSPLGVLIGILVSIHAGDAVGLDQKLCTSFTFHHLLNVDLGFHLHWTIEVTRAHHFRQVLVSCWRLVSFKVSRRAPFSMSPFMRYLFDPRENKKNAFLFSCF